MAATAARLGILRLNAGRLNAILAPPPAPASPNPAHGSSRGPWALTWVSEGAGNFDVYFGTSATPPLVSTAQTASTYTLPALTAGTVYYWRVVARNEFGTTSGPTWTFTAAVPSPPTSPTPAHGATNQPNSLTLAWVAPATPDPITYTLTYNAGSGPVVVPGLAGLSYAIGPLPNATAVLWSVQAVNNAGPSTSPTWTFTTWTLGTPTLLSPANGAVEVSATTALVWAAAANALSYDVYFGPSSTPPLVSSGQTALLYDPPGRLDARVTYAWRIVARNAGGTVSSVTWSFTTTDPTELHISIGGVTPHMRIAGLAITDQLNDRPNTCEFVVDTTPPHVGQVVVLGLGTLAITDLIFAGTVDQVEAVYDAGRPAQHAWRVRSVDWWRRFNKDKITRHYDAQSATAIAINLVQTFAPGYSTAGIAAGLPIVSGGIDVIQADLGEALRQLMTRVGGYWYVDYGQIVHAFLEETTQLPDPLVPTLASLMLDPPVTLSHDLSQIRTRVLVQGGSSTAQTDVAAGGAEIPVDDASWYRPTGGFEVVIGPYRMPYTGTFAGGSGSVVRGEEAPTGAAGTPAAAITTGVGGVLGLVTYVVTFKNAIGETLPGPASNTVTGIPVAAPGSAPTPAAVAGVGRLAGTYLYASTVVTARGETTLGPTAPFAATPFAAPSSPPAVSLASGLGHLIGAFSYCVAFVTAHGETLAGPGGARTAIALAAPSALTLNAGGVGPLIGAYSYRVTFVTALGETTGGTVQARTASAGAWSGTSNLSASGVGPLVGTYSYRLSYVTAYGETLGGSGSIAPTVTTAAAPSVSATPGSGFLIDYAVTYVHPQWGESALSARTTVQTTVFNITCNGLPAGCGWNLYSSGSNASGGPLYKIAERPNNNTTFTHSGQTGPAGDPNPTMGRGILLSSMQAGPTGTVARRIYRTKVGGSSYYLVGEIANGITSFTDVAPDSSLTAPAPSFNTTGEAIAVSGIALGSSGVVARRLYRTKAGGASYYLVGELADNTTSTYSDTVPDDSLTASLPVVHTAGGQRHSVSVALGPSGTLARRIYRTKAGETMYHQLAELPENTTTSYVDDTPDDGLSGAGPALVSTAGGLNADVSLPVGPAGTTSRRLYRTKAGAAGSLFLVGQVNGNAAGSLLDEKRDSELGRIAPNGNDAGASVVLLSSIPIGPASITGRRLYRRDAAGVYRFVVELKDNTTTTHTDDKDEDKLGDVAPTVSTIGALPGTTTLLVAATWPFRPAGGWITSGSQIIRYSGVSGFTLTGIPASGPGSLVAALKAGDEVIATPMIIGVTSTAPIARGDPVAVLERVDDVAAQAALAALEGAGSDGIYVHVIRDPKLDYSMAHATGVADLQLFARPIETLTYVSRDPKTGTGKTIHVDLPGLGILGDYTIQQVRIDQIGVSPGVFPRYTVTASSSRFSFEDALRRLALLP